MRLALLTSVLLLVPACTLFFDDGGKRPDPCVTAGDDQPQPEGVPQAQRDPATLTCETFGGQCDETCGPCPAVADSPAVTWGVCGSPCEQLDEAACGNDASCRVVRDARCAVGGTCETDFLGCFPVDMAPDAVDCFTDDAWTCSRSSACTAFHRSECGVRADTPPEQCARQFAMCMPAGGNPGKCFEQALCDRVAPSCPPNSVPGVANGCYTNACIPNDLCEPKP